MKESWSDFEKFVFQELKEVRKDLEHLSDRISKLEGRAAVWGAISGILAASVADLFFKWFFNVG